MKIDTTSRGPWMQTFTGKQFHPGDPRVEDIDILSTAHALSMICRYGGFPKRFYSVAEHSYLMARYAREVDDMTPMVAWATLLHDAHEAYFVDFPKAWKAAYPVLKALENNIEEVVHQALGLTGVSSRTWAYIKNLDDRICADEKKLLMPGGYRWNVDSLEPLGVKVMCYAPHEAKMIFLDYLAKLTEEMDDA